VSDKEKRDAAVDAFAGAIKARLDEQAAKGYSGWGGEYPYYALCDEIAGDAICASQHKTADCGRYAIDIGARAMMLHFRACKEVRGE
jgi:hypothetical protein